MREQNGYQASWQTWYIMTYHDIFVIRIMTYHEISWNLCHKNKKHYFCRENAQLQHFCRENLWLRAYRYQLTKRRRIFYADIVRSKVDVRDSTCLSPMRLTYPVRVPRVSDGEQCTHHWLLCPSAPWPTNANLYFSRTIDMTPTPTLTCANIWHKWCQSILRQEKCEGSSSDG